MKQIPNILCFILLLISGGYISAQDFVTRAKIEFQKKENIQRMIARSNVPQQFRDRVIEDRITYYDLIFSGDRAIYKAGRELPKVPGGFNQTTIHYPKNTNILFSNYSNQQKVSKKNVLDEEFIVEDSLPPISWKIGQEIRTIAGYSCRKAVGRIYDSVYVVAFYAEEFVVKGGPEGFHGLPGMILQLAIPRYNTVWIATKIELAEVDESVINPPVLKGKKIAKEETRIRLQKKAAQFNIQDPVKFADGYFGKNYFL
jgi:GLPGLI family protein